MRGELRDRVASGVAWNMAEKAGSMLLQAVVSLVVLRLLMPEDLGVMAIPTVFSALALVVVDSGFSQTLIRKYAPTQGDYKSVFLFNIVVSLLLYVLLVALAPVAARFYDMPVLTRIAPVLFLLLPLNALCVIQNTIFTRQFRFALISKVVFISTLAGGVVAVAMALAGCGVWSLVGQRVTAMGTKAALFWALSDWRPRAPYDGGALRRMAPYSTRLLTTDLIASVYNNISQLFVGRMYSADTLAYFNQAQKLKELPVTGTVQSVQNVTFPALAKIAEDGPKFAESYRQMVLVVTFVMFPAMAGLNAVAHDFFAVFLGTKWMPIVPYFRIACLGGLFAPVAMISYNVLKVKSNGSVIVRLEVAKKLVMTGILALTIPRGPIAITWGLAVAALFEMAINFGATRRYTLFTTGCFLRTLLPAAAASGLMFGAILLLERWTAFPPALALLIKTVLGAGIYVAVAAALRFEAFGVAVGLMKKFIRRG